MDVRAVDTSLAARRTEPEEVQSSKEKPPFIISRIASRTSQEAGGRVSRSKSSTERETEHGEDEDEHSDDAGTRGRGDAAGDEIESASGAPVPIEEHILDVKV